MMDKVAPTKGEIAAQLRRLADNMEKEKGLLLAYYGDDFTGSTDALEFLNLADVKTILFLKNPKYEFYNF